MFAIIKSAEQTRRAVRAEPRKRAALQDAARPKIQSLGRAARLLELIALRHETGVTLTELASLSGLNKTTAFHLLDSLETLQFVERMPQSRSFRLGQRNLELGAIMLRQLKLAERARDALERLSRETRETVSLAQSLPDSALIVDSIEGSYSLRATSYVGTRCAYHATACGKASFAHWPSARRRALYDAGPLVGFTASSVVDPTILEAQLERIRGNLPALDLEENEIGAHCVARPVFDASHAVIGAVSIAGLKQRMTPSVLERLDSALVREVAEISHRLGYRPSGA